MHRWLRGYTRKCIHEFGWVPAGAVRALPGETAALYTYLVNQLKKLMDNGQQGVRAQKARLVNAVKLALDILFLVMLYDTGLR